MPVLDIANDDVSSRKARRVLGEFQYDQHGSVVQARVPMMLRDSAECEIGGRFKRPSRPIASAMLLMPPAARLACIAPVRALRPTRAPAMRC